MRVASTSAGEAGMLAEPGAIGVNDDADTLIVVLVLMRRMIYDRLLSEMPRFFTIGGVLICYIIQWIR